MKDALNDVLSFGPLAIPAVNFYLSKSRHDRTLKHYLEGIRYKRKGKLQKALEKLKRVADSPIKALDFYR